MSRTSLRFAAFAWIAAAWFHLYSHEYLSAFVVSIWALAAAIMSLSAKEPS